ncbi:ADP-heptose:LPS heptosyltransferase [Paucidesulfovibrio gracilis DSM 16080]|uniref:ADP-heptose:LPS heptosyltransferase n=1 Tax=Paucidesulfovibrio gracilis DSM 16080 TaxID=1121449 RepID=A0A1T4Y2N1_9BACT|nr:glycosyltransferase family 9 protein [Paucidesulfovibrio gracilis]SKA96000.1 ADP-heptose:LPS heptosyltransferase [Paucidesulfovibrio gracilis DSM 16080]
MTQDPILILQMQRMGDLILSFPLMLWLQRLHPGRPVWVAAERGFYEPLMPLSPGVTYFPWEGVHVLKRHRYKLVINLSIRERAARLAGELDADAVLGPTMRGDLRRINGPWQLYRAALVRNNRHNRLHWADLNALDCVPLERLRATRFDPPRPPAKQKPQVGLFLGASDPAKRPDAVFWAELLRELVRRDIRPVLFGGPAEKQLGRETRERFGKPVPDFCGRLPLSKLAKGLNACSLLITPDTGPMHLAAWTGCRTLNLSMGNVSPHETGPYQPGHLVLRADLPCSEGCWECSRDRLDCHDAFTPEAVAFVAARAVRGKDPNTPPDGLRLYTTQRDEAGLFCLHRFTDRIDPDERLGTFWKTFFGWRLGLWDKSRAHAALLALAQNAPMVFEELASALPRGVTVFSRALARGTQTATPPVSLWEAAPQALAPLSGLADMDLQNRDFSREAMTEQVGHLEALGRLLARC